MAKDNCVLCGKSLGFASVKIKCADGYVHEKCFYDIAGQYLYDPGFVNRVANIKGEDIKREIAQINQAQLARQSARSEELHEIQAFVPTYSVRNIAHFDDTSERMILCNEPHFSYPPEVYTLFHYNQIVSFELLEDNSSVMKGRVGSSLVGGLAFGAVGAVIGSSAGRKVTSTCESLRIKITVRNYHSPAFYIDFIKSPLKKGNEYSPYGVLLKQAHDIMSKLMLIAESLDNASTDNSEMHTASRNPAEEIRQFKALLDEGIITQEEFDRKKQQLLNL